MGQYLLKITGHAELRLLDRYAVLFAEVALEFAIAMDLSDLIASFNQLFFCFSEKFFVFSEKKIYFSLSC